MNKFWLNTSIIAVFCAVAFYLYVKFRVAPDIDFVKLNLTNLEGKNIKFSELRNKATFLSFSTSWCGACIEELIELKSLREKNELQEISIVVVSDEPLNVIRNFKEVHQFDFEFYSVNKPFSEIGINTIPSNYFLNKKFEIVEKHIGEVNWSDPSTQNYYLKLMQ